MYCPCEHPCCGFITVDARMGLAYLFLIAAVPVISVGDSSASAFDWTGMLWQAPFCEYLISCQGSMPRPPHDGLWLATCYGGQRHKSRSSKTKKVRSKSKLSRAKSQEAEKQKNKKKTETQKQKRQNKQN